jgi:hypothetical protein
MTDVYQMPQRMNRKCCGKKINKQTNKGKMRVHFTAARSEFTKRPADDSMRSVVHGLRNFSWSFNTCKKSSYELSGRRALRLEMNMREGLPSSEA